MSHVGKGYDINQTFIIESAVDAEPIFSACTALYTTNILSCSGNTSIFLGNGVINFGGSLYTNNDLSANTISATTFYGDGSNLTGVLTQDTFVTGGTYNNGTAVFTNNTGGTFNVTGFYAGATDVFVTGATYNNNTFTFTNNTGSTFDVLFDVVTGLTINGGLTATTINGDGSNISGINFSQLATTAHTHPISDVINLQNNLDSKIDKPANPFLGDYLYYNGVTWVPNQVNIPVSAGAGIVLFLSITGSSLPTYEYLSQFPVEINETQEPVVVNNNQVLIGKYATEQLGRTVVDPGIWEFNTYASVDIPSTGLTQIIVNTYLLTTGGSETFLFSAATENITTTAATVYTISVVEPQYSCNTTDYLVVNYSASTTNNFNTTVTLYHGGILNYSHIHTPFVTLHNDLAGIQGGFSNEHYHLSKNEVDLLTTGLDASSIHNHDSLYLGLGGGTVSGATNFTNGLTTTTFSATTYQNLPTDIRVTGATYSNNTFTYTNNTGGTFNVLFNTVTGLTVNGNLIVTGNTSLQGLTATTISATTYQNLPTDIRVTGGTKSGSVITFTNNTGGTFTVTGITDTFVTGGTYNSGTSIITFVNNTGGTFTVTGIAAGGGGAGPISVSGTTLYSNNPATSNFSTTNSIFFGSNAGSGATNAIYSNFLGESAGYQATGANSSNFLGTQAGFQATNAFGSNFLGASAGQGATNAVYSNFFGYQAGQEATNAGNSNFFGQQAGYQATGASQSNFLGQQAGQGATNAGYSNFLGLSAGYQATGANDSNFLGASAGQGATNAFGSNFLGNGAGFQATTASGSNFLGAAAGYQATGASYSNFLGVSAGYRASGASYSNFFGADAGDTARNANNSNFFGQTAGFVATNANNSNFFGTSAGNGATNANNSNFFGFETGYQASNASFSNLFGFNVGKTFAGNNLGSNNIIIGTNISLPNGATDSINIGGVLFGINTYSTTGGTSSITPQASGRIGIGVVTPQETLHVSGNTRIQGGLTATTISATTYQNLPTDIRVTGGTYNSGTSIITFTNNTGGTFTVTGITAGGGGTGPISVSGASLYSNNPATSNFSTSDSIFFGANAGFQATNASFSNFFGFETGYQASGASFSNFFGNQAGYQATSATRSNFLGWTAGYQATGASYSNLFGFNVGRTFTGNNLGSNNIIIGTNISLPNAAANAINIGGVLFGINTYSTVGGDPSITPQTNGRIGIGVVTPQERLHVSGNTLINGTLTATTALFSSSTQNVLNVVGSGSTSPIFRVQGSQGELFAVTDSLTGSLFSVNDISGLPIMEVFSDNTILMGSYFAPSLNTTYRLIVNSGSTNLYSIPVSAYTGAFYDYTVSDASNARAGNIMAIFSGTSVQYTETSTLDIGSTTGVTFSVAISSGNAVLRVSATTNNWSVKTIIRSI